MCIRDRIGNAIAPVFAPLGFGDWQSSVATITGLVAKENVVATMGVLHGIPDATEETVALLQSVAGSFTVVSAFSFMAFNLLCAPCFAAIGAIKREMGNAKWTWAAIGYQTLLAYVVAFIIFQLGSCLLYTSLARNITHRSSSCFLTATISSAGQPVKAFVCFQFPKQLLVLLRKRASSPPNKREVVSDRKILDRDLLQRSLTKFFFDRRFV